jgi:hypothetical protein
MRLRLLNISMFFVAICFLPIHAALGEEPTNQGKNLVDEATTYFANGEFDKSKKLLLQAKSSTQDPALLARVHLFLGLNALIDGNQPQAARSFEVALSYNAEIDLDPDRFKPEFVEVFRRVRDRATGEIAVSADEPSAIVSIDGKSRGAVPFKDKVGIGAHLVEVKLASGELLLSKKVMLRAGEKKELAVVVPRKRAATRPAAADAAPQVTPKAHRRRWTWVALGGTAVALGLAIGFSAAAYSNHKDGCQLVDPQGIRECKPDPATTLSSSDASRYEDFRTSLDRNRLVANISWGLTGGLAVASALLFWYEGRAIEADHRATKDRQVSLHFWAPPSAQLGVGIGASY